MSTSSPYLHLSTSSLRLAIHVTTTTTMSYVLWPILLSHFLSRILSFISLFRPFVVDTCIHTGLLFTIAAPLLVQLLLLLLLLLHYLTTTFIVFTITTAAATAAMNDNYFVKELVAHLLPHNTCIKCYNFYLSYCVLLQYDWENLYLI